MLDGGQDSLGEEARTRKLAARGSETRAIHSRLTTIIMRSIIITTHHIIPMMAEVGIIEGHCTFTRFSRGAGAMIVRTYFRCC